MWFIAEAVFERTLRVLLAEVDVDRFVRISSSFRESAGSLSRARSGSCGRGISSTGTEHILVGAGDGPCVIFMVGGRSEDWNVVYPVSELAARYGASAELETTDPDEAYMGYEPSRIGRPSYWGRLP